MCASRAQEASGAASTVLSLRLLVKTVRTGVGVVRWQRVPSQTASFALLEGGAIHGEARTAPSVPFVRQERMGHTRDNFNRMLATAVRLAGGDQNQVGLQLRTAAAVQWVHGAMSLEQATSDPARPVLLAAGVIQKVLTVTLSADIVCRVATAIWKELLHPALHARWDAGGTARWVPTAVMLASFARSGASSQHRRRLASPAACLAPWGTTPMNSGLPLVAIAALGTSVLPSAALPVSSARLEPGVVSRALWAKPCVWLVAMIAVQVPLYLFPGGWSIWTAQPLTRSSEKTFQQLMPRISRPPLAVSLLGTFEISMATKPRSA